MLIEILKKFNLKCSIDDVGISLGNRFAPKRDKPLP